jgi:succinyl-CoA synthetase beta subunit
MKLFEYQAKEVFAAHGLSVPQGSIATDSAGAEQAAVVIGFPCVLKSQVLRGGRGKAGLIKVVHTPLEAEKAARDLFNSPHGVRKILVEKAVDIARELYLSITVDPLSARALILACSDGGVEIETLARTAPEKIVREYVDLDTGLLPFAARNCAYSLGLEGDLAKKFALVVESLYKLFRNLDAELVEINPLFVTKSGDLVAGDGKLSIDDNSMSRHPEWEPGRDYFGSEVEFEAYKEGIPYLQFDGDISLMCAGAGLTTTVYDLIADSGGTVANYLEFGGPNYRKGLRAMELCVRNNPKVILIVTFGTIARADVMAEGIVQAMEALKPKCPIVVCIRGTGEDAAAATLRAAGLDPLTDTEMAVKRAVELARGETGGHA